MNMRNEYDYIIIDCPPLGSVIDAALVAKVCDGTIIVIEADGVSYKTVPSLSSSLTTSAISWLRV